MKDGLLIHTDYCLTPTTTLHNAAIVLQDGRFLAIGGFSAFIHTENYHVIEMPECYLMPGFVDTHLYGAGGFDCLGAETAKNIGGMSRILAEHGVTSFVPTTQSCPQDKLLTVTDALADLVEKPMPGAVPAGIHIEGPYLSAERPGAHNKDYLRAVDLAEVEDVLAAGRGKVCILTFAPEVPGALDLIARLREHNVSPCMGHTVAEEEQLRAAVDAGANRCSHLYNGMEPIHQRKLGLAAIALIDERIWVEIITDGVHIHPAMIDLACRSKPRDKIIGISNSNEAAGLADGVYKLGDETIVVVNGKSKLREGVLAGGVSFLDLNYHYMLDNTHLTQEAAAACFTVNAARSIGLADRGELKPGKRGDILVLNRDHEVQMTIVQGRVVFDRQGKAAGVEAVGAERPA